MKQAKRPLPIDKNELLDYFQGSTFDRGEKYFAENRVDFENIDYTLPDLSGYVYGSRKRPYITRVRFISKKKVWSINTCTCTCPVYFDCKHAVALLLAAGKLYGFAGEDESLFALYKDDKAISMKTAKWLQQLDVAISATRAKESAPREIQQPSGIIYILQPIARNPNRELAPGVYYRTRGNKSSLKEITTEHILNSRESTTKDLLIAQLLQTYFEHRAYAFLYENEEDDNSILETGLCAMLSTGRCFSTEQSLTPLQLGPTLQANLKWEPTPTGRLAPALGCDDSASKTYTFPLPWYINEQTGLSGPLRLTIPQKIVDVFLSAPHVEHSETEAIKTYIEKFAPEQPTLLPAADWQREIVEKDPEKKIKLLSKTVTYSDDALKHRGYTFGHPAPFVCVSFDYGIENIDLDSNKKEITITEGNTIKTIVRNLDLERKHVRELQAHSLEALPNWFSPRNKIPFMPTRDTHEKTVSIQSWFRFLNIELPELQKKGWEVEIDPSFTIQSVEAAEHWSSKLEGDGSGWWFELDLGIEVDGVSMPLLPILVQALKRAPFIFGPEDLESLNVDGKFYAPLDDGRHVALPFERVRDLLSIILDIYDRDAENDQVLINVVQAAELSAASINLNLDAYGNLKNLADRIKNFKGIVPIDAPDGFHATLREYQKEGLGWLNFLRELETGGILADDMGLGKTIQTLCQLLIEKREGRLAYPALIVCPTSVLPNWLNEAKKFTPDLKVLALHGSNRQINFDAIYEHDIVVTTYPLIHRDSAYLAQRFWHVVVLDEAQFIRNPDTLSAQAAFSLNANYRICLTGTPVENHLGDLWSQFHFLMPGYLGDQKHFQKYFRQPIEKSKNSQRLRSLSQRIRPFMLRRTKSEVAHELPEKTVIEENVQLQGAQRDLYETVRVTMQKRVKEEIALKGFKRSQIVILEALLRLRQACCDPRLLGSKFSHKAKESAKLSRLMEMVRELVEENRKMLIFSQFTSMLDLIADELNRNKIEYVEIRGDTKDRATPVEKFQNGNVPVFLLSLKAGGTGLNLTAADTVIHFDPWWNPAVENQATDRAHRIGQKKPVFVYKLIAEGTIEKKMLALQERKRALAEGIFDEASAGSINISEEELDNLFRPMNEEEEDDDNDDLDDRQNVRETDAKYKSSKDKLLELQIPMTTDDDSDIDTSESQRNKKASDFNRKKSDKKVDSGKERNIPKTQAHSAKKISESGAEKKDNALNEQKKGDKLDPFIEALLKQGFTIEDIKSGNFLKKT